MDTESPLAIGVVQGSLDMLRRSEMRLRNRRVAWGNPAYANILYVGGGLVKWNRLMDTPI